MADKAFREKPESQIFAKRFRVAVRGHHPPFVQAIKVTFGSEAGLLELIHRARTAGLMLLLVLLLCAAPPFANAGDNAAARVAQHAGLMWNRSGLPAVFPLQVKTPPGQDYFLTLINENTGEAALAAYIKGGTFFKVLVPPGIFRLSFAAGDVWQGEDNLFGPGADTHSFELREPLTFETRGFGIKAGHVVSLLARGPGQITEVTLKDQLICQSLKLEFPSSIYSAWEMEQARGFRHQWQIGPTGQALGQGEGIFDRSRHRSDHRRIFTMPRYDVWSRYCE